MGREPCRTTSRIPGAKAGVEEWIWMRLGVVVRDLVLVGSPELGGRWALVMVDRVAGGVGTAVWGTEVHGRAIGVHRSRVTKVNVPESRKERGTSHQDLRCLVHLCVCRGAIRSNNRTHA
jgi:hypothetical protein